MGEIEFDVALPDGRRRRMAAAALPRPEEELVVGDIAYEVAIVQWTETIVEGGPTMYRAVPEVLLSNEHRQDAIRLPIASTDTVGYLLFDRSGPPRGGLQDLVAHFTAAGDEAALSYMAARDLFQAERELVRVDRDGSLRSVPLPRDEDSPWLERLTARPSDGDVGAQSAEAGAPD